MREKLKEVENIRIKVIAEVGRFGEKPAWRGSPVTTICLVNLKDEYDNILCDHLWLTVGKQIKNLKLSKGDKIKFEARSKGYTKGYFGRREDVYVPIETDYKLSHPTKFEKLN